MSLDFDEIDRLARPGRAFANSTEWESWSYNWCERCLRDAPFRNGLRGASGCSIIMVAMLGEKTPAEWMEQPRDEEGRYSLTDQYHCIEAKFPGGGSGEPRPKPEPPSMDGLFERPARGSRMYVQPQRQEVAAS